MARDLWHLLEPIHAVTYFSEESRGASQAVGLKGFWMGYFAFRASPLGPVGAGVAEALFANFARSMIERSVPDAWTHASPAAALEARSGAGAAALRRLVPSVDRTAAIVVPVLHRAIESAPAAGRPMFAANRDLAWPSDPVAQLWQAATTLREHRGDGHVACIVAVGLNGCQAHVLFAASEGVPVAVLRDNRGWTEGEWQAATSRLERDGLLDRAGVTEEGRDIRAALEGRTDALAAQAYEVLGDDDLRALRQALAPTAAEIIRSGVIPFPNPMGLPPSR